MNKTGIMKKIYLAGLAASLLIFSGCSKDVLKSYDERIIGTWQITEVNKFGFGGDANDLPFTSGSLSFMRDGSLLYTDAAGSIYKGTWDIRKKTVDDGTVYRSLQITAVNFINQEVRGEYYDDINFTGTNHIKARIFSGLHTYTTHLER
jgi:hypothetical protein